MTLHFSCKDQKVADYYRSQFLPQFSIQAALFPSMTEAEIAELRMSAGATYTYCDRCRDDPLSPDLFRWTGTGWEILPE